MKLSHKAKKNFEEDNQFYKEDFELEPVHLFIYLKESEHE